MAMHSTNTAIQRSTKVAAKKKAPKKPKMAKGELIDMVGAKKSKQTGTKDAAALKEHDAPMKSKKAMMFGGGKKAMPKKKAAKKK